MDPERLVAYDPALDVELGSRAYGHLLLWTVWGLTTVLFRRHIRGWAVKQDGRWWPRSQGNTLAP